VSATATLIDRSARPSLGRLARVEGRKMLDTRAGFWLLLLTALAAVAGVIGERLSVGDDVAFGRLYLTSIATASLLPPVIAVLLVTSEWSQRTGLITFTLVPVRGRIVAAKLIAALALALAVSALCLLLAAIGAATASGAGLELGELGRGLLYQSISVTIGIGIGLLVMNSPAAIVFLFLGPLVMATLGAISDGIEDVTSWLDQSVMEKLVNIGDLSSEEWQKVAVTVAFWALLPLAAGMLRLRRGDID
jgi:ABC-2 type transport system permease protein